MASATTRLAFSFHLHSTHTKPSRRRPKTLVNIPTLHSQKLFASPSPCPPRLQFTSRSVEVSKEDKPISSVDVSEEDKPISGEPDLTVAPDDTPFPETEKLDKRRLPERFAVLNTGIYECRSCGHKYDEAVGDPSYPIPPGLQFEKLPEDWRCPTCGAAKSFFESKSVEIAGFAENQQFGLGGNALTSGQKAVLIYGSLFFFFLLFLSGYFLQ